jgi:transposase
MNAPYHKSYINPLSPELNPICYFLALLAHDFLHVSRIRVKSLMLREQERFENKRKIYLYYKRTKAMGLMRIRGYKCSSRKDT